MRLQHLHLLPQILDPLRIGAVLRLDGGVHLLDLVQLADERIDSAGLNIGLLGICLGIGEKIGGCGIRLSSLCGRGRR